MANHEIKPEQAQQNTDGGHSMAKDEYQPKQEHQNTNGGQLMAGDRVRFGIQPSRQRF